MRRIFGVNSWRWDHVKSNCSWDMFLWKNPGGLHAFMCFS